MSSFNFYKNLVNFNDVKSKTLICIKLLMLLLSGLILMSVFLELFNITGIASFSDSPSKFHNYEFFGGDIADNNKVIYTDIVINFNQFGAKGNARYYNFTDSMWYEDINFKIPASDDSVAIQNAVNYASSLSKPVRIIACPGKSYYFSKDILITSSHITIDMQGARVVSNARFHFKGNPANKNGALEDDSLLLTDVHFTNATFGNKEYFDVACRGPKMEFVRNSSISNCNKSARGGTSFNLSFAKNCQVNNVHIYGARPVGEKDTIGILLHHTINCIVKDCSVGGSGQWIYGVQQKGGYDNQWINVVCHDMHDISKGNIIRDRGDAPYHASGSTGPYPYFKGSWDKPDSRRASHNTIFVNCTVRNIPLKAVGFKAREAQGTCFIDCHAFNARGIVLQKDKLAPADYDDYYLVKNFEGKNVALPIMIYSDNTIPIQHTNIYGMKITNVKPIANVKKSDITISNLENAQIKDVIIEKSKGVSICAISLDRAKNITFTNVKLVDSFYKGNSIILINNNTCSNNIFDNCNFIKI